MIELLEVPPNCIRIWEVWVNSDSCEGRGPMILEARFLKRDAAAFFARGKGPMGMSDANIRQAIVYDTHPSFQKDKDVQLRQATLRRLSSEEKRVLGLS